MIKRKASAIWQGGLKDGKGTKNGLVQVFLHLPRQTDLLRLGRTKSRLRVGETPR